MSRRLDGVQLDSPGLDRTARDSQNTEGIRPASINRRRLNSIGKTAAKTREAVATTQADRPDQAQPQNGSAARQSLDEILIDFVMPRITDPVILRRSIAILQHCITDIVPRLEGGDQLKGLARALMLDEIERHRELGGQVQGGKES